MVIRRFESGARAVPGRSSFPSIVACLAFAAAVVAQAPGVNSPPASPSGQPAAAPPPAATTAPAATPTFARIVAEQAPLRCWSGAVASPPVFEETLAKDQVVAVGRSENGFRAIVLPLGPIGYVSRKFTETSAEGRVKTKGTKVAFRYRPRSSEAPVSQLAEGTELHVIAEQDDWFRVRVPGVDAWVAEAEVLVGDQADPALAKAYDEWRGKHEAEVKARLDQVAQKRAREVQDQADLAAVQVVQDAFGAELKKPIPEQKFAPLTETLDKLLPTLAAESAARPAVEALKKRIETQNWIVEASAVRDTKPPAGEEVQPEKKDSLARFQSIGWLRYERRLSGPGVYFLEKGGQRQYVLSCNTNRYDLALFVDREVGVVGPRRRPVTESMSVLDVERLEVLGIARK